MKLKTNIKLSRTKKKSTFRQHYRNKVFFAFTATGQTRQEIPPIHKRIQHQTRKGSKQQMEKIKTPHPDSLCTPHGTWPQFLHTSSFFSTRISGSCVFTIEKGRGGNASVTNGEEMNGFADCARWYELTTRTEIHIGDFHLLRLFRTGQNKFRTKWFFLPYGDLKKTHYLLLCKKGYSTS